jgi:hypothetical protein
VMYCHTFVSPGTGATVQTCIAPASLVLRRFGMFFERLKIFITLQ